MKTSKKRARLLSIWLMFTLYTVSVLSAVVLVVNATDLNAAQAKEGAYVLVADNDSLGCKMYARMINGVMVDDYYLEFYDDGVLTNVSKSAFTMTDSDVMMVEAQIKQIGRARVMMQNILPFTKFEYSISCIDGEWRLIERHSEKIGSCDCQVKHTYYDAITGEEIPR